MSTFTTAADLKTDALQLAGEPQDGSSSYDSRVYDYMNAVQNVLISGGALGRGLVRVADWWWARKYPRGSLTLIAATNAGNTISATFTSGSTAVTLDTSIATDLTNYRVNVQGSVRGQPYVQSNSGTGITLASAWPDTTQTTKLWVAYKPEYDLASDFVRFASPFLLADSPYRIDVVDPRALEDEFPFGTIGQATPVLAALVGERRVRFSHYPDASILTEYEYIAQPTALDAGATPILPYQHRRLLSYGVAYLILLDKNDSSAAELYDLFTSQWQAMDREQRFQVARGSERFGVVFPRSLDRPLRRHNDSGSGTIWWGW